MNWDENVKALRTAIAADCAAEMEETHVVDPAELARQLPGAKMEQKETEHVHCAEARDGVQLKKIKRLLYTLDSPKALSTRLQKQLMGSDGLRHLVAAMIIRLIDY